MSHILQYYKEAHRQQGFGSLGRMMKEDGFELYITDAKRTVPDRTYDALVVLGGPQSANDKEQYLRSEEDAILRHADAGLPVLNMFYWNMLLVHSWQLKHWDLQCTLEEKKRWDFTMIWYQYPMRNCFQDWEIFARFIGIMILLISLKELCALLNHASTKIKHSGTEPWWDCNFI